VRVFQKERELEIESVRVCMRKGERERECASVCMRKKERKKERTREIACMRVRESRHPFLGLSVAAGNHEVGLWAKAW